VKEVRAFMGDISEEEENLYKASKKEINKFKTMKMDLETIQKIFFDKIIYSSLNTQKFSNEE
jgi:hypothetical protein